MNEVVNSLILLYKMIQITSIFIVVVDILLSFFEFLSNVYVKENTMIDSECYFKKDVIVF